MSTQVCEKHRKKPVRIYGSCIGCEIEDMRRDLKAKAEEIVILRKRVAFLAESIRLRSPL